MMVHSHEELTDEESPPLRYDKSRTDLERVSRLAALPLIILLVGEDQKAKVVSTKLLNRESETREGGKDLVST